MTEQERQEYKAEYKKYRLNEIEKEAERIQRDNDLELERQIRREVNAELSNTKKH